MGFGYTRCVFGLLRVYIYINKKWSTPCCSFPTNRAMRRPFYSGTGQQEGSTTFYCIQTNPFRVKQQIITPEKGVPSDTNFFKNNTAMKKLMFFAVVLFTMGLAACSSENDTPQTPEQKTVNLAPSRASEVMFYSNGNKLDANGQIAEAAKSAKYAPFYATRAALPDSVEVNLSVTEHKDNANETKLAIHVRSTSDVTVFIPTSAKYYCPAEEMAIVQSHKYNAEVYGTEEHAEISIDGNKVELNIAFAENGITVTTSGMNAAVQDYLYKEYGDGLTFEIHNYFNAEMLEADNSTTTLTEEGLKAVLDGKTTISFTHTPKHYASAYGLLEGNGEKEVYIRDKEGNIIETLHLNPLDCRVVPADASLFESNIAESWGGHTYIYMYTRK